MDSDDFSSPPLADKWPFVLFRSNNRPTIVVSTYVLVLGACTLRVVHFIRHCATTMPNTTTACRGHTFVLAAFGLLSLIVVTGFRIRWFALDYICWSETQSFALPSSFWLGWHASPNGVGRWRLSDWMDGREFVRSIRSQTVRTTEGYFYTSQHWMGHFAVTVFVGLNGYRRQFPESVKAALIALNWMSSLGFSLSLMLIAMLHTRVADTVGDPRSVAVPHSKLLSWPGWFMFGNMMIYPQIMGGPIQRATAYLSYIATFVACIAPKVSEIRSDAPFNTDTFYCRVFYWLSWASGIVYWRVIIPSIWDHYRNPAEPSYIAEVFFSNIESFPFNSRTYRKFYGFTHTDILYSKNPMVSANGLDVMFTATVLLYWVWRRNSLCDYIVGLSFLYPWFSSPESEFRYPIFDLPSDQRLTNYGGDWIFDGIVEVGSRGRSPQGLSAGPPQGPPHGLFGDGGGRSHIGNVSVSSRDVLADRGRGHNLFQPGNIGQGDNVVFDEGPNQQGQSQQPQGQLQQSTAQPPQVAGGGTNVVMRRSRRLAIMPQVSYKGLFRGVDNADGQFTLASNPKKPANNPTNNPANNANQVQHLNSNNTNPTQLATNLNTPNLDEDPDEDPLYPAWGESMAICLFLFFTGGLGTLASVVLGETSIR